jgi:monoamine oxidase
MANDVVVIGAGISGLSAAMLLVEQGFSVVVLEARDRVGGRTYTIRDNSYGGYTDVGGAYVGPTQRRVARLAKRFGLEFYKVDVEQNTLMNIAENRYKYTGTVPPIYNPIAALDVNHLQRSLEAMSKLVPADAPWIAENAQQWDSITLKEYIDKTCWTKIGREVAALTCRAVLSVEMHEVSLLAFLWYMSSGQGFQRVVNVTNGAQESKFVGGSQQLSESMAGFLEERVHLSSPVIRVDQTQDLIKASCVINFSFIIQSIVRGLFFQ